MMRRALTSILAALVIDFALASSGYGAPSVRQGGETYGKIREQIARVAPQPKSRVQVKLRDGRKLKGYVTETSTDDFLLSDSRTATSARIRYADVKQVKGSHGENSGLKKATQIMSFVGLGLVVVIMVAALSSPN